MTSHASDMCGYRWLLVATSLLGIALSGQSPAYGQRAPEEVLELPADRVIEVLQPRQLPEPTPDGPAMRERVYSRLAQAQASADAGDAATARRLVEEVRAMSDLNGYETAQMWNFYGYIYARQNSYREAIRAYESVLEQPDVPQSLAVQTMQMLSQLYFQQEQYQQSLDMLSKWFALAETPDPEAYILQAQLHYQLGQYAEGVTPAETALELAWAQGVEVREDWYRLLNALYYELEDYPNMMRVLRIMLESWPKREYFLQLASIYGQEGDGQRQLAMYEVAYEAGWLGRSTELVNYAQMLLQVGIPYKAALILEAGLENGTIESNETSLRVLAQAWQLAHEDEKAIPALTRAASLAQDGNLDIRLAESYQNLAKWRECVEAARTSLAKGALRRPDQASMVLGACLFELRDFDEARAAFQAAASDPRSADIAQNWLRYIEAERDRERQLAQALQRG